MEGTIRGSLLSFFLCPQRTAHSATKFCQLNKRPLSEAQAGAGHWKWSETAKEGEKKTAGLFGFSLQNRRPNPCLWGGPAASSERSRGINSYQQQERAFSSRTSQNEGHQEKVRASNGGITKPNCLNGMRACSRACTLRSACLSGRGRALFQSPIFLRQKGSE